MTDHLARRAGVPLSDIQTYTDESGHTLHYVRRVHPGSSGLGIHFSAFFFGAVGNSRAYRDVFGGYFHRLRMLGDDTSHDWLFLCDEYGFERDGTYYTGERGDFFVERAVQTILEQAWGEWGYTRESTVMVGSSMGATAALKFGLRNRVCGIVAIGPHIDLDICAERQGRYDHVAFICPDGDPTSEQNWPLTRQIRASLATWSATAPLPRLFVQSCEDDDGVHVEQVLPLVDLYRELGGIVDLDSRPIGGHTSDWAPRSLLLEVIDCLLAAAVIDVDTLQTDVRYRGKRTIPPMWWRARQWVARRRMTRHALRLIRSRRS